MIKPYKHVSIYLVFITLYTMVLTFVSVDKILKCDLSNKSYWAVLSGGTVCYAVQGDCNFCIISVAEILKCDHPLKV